MIEKLIVTKTPSKYYDNGKIFIYSYHYEKTDFENINDLVAHYKERDCKDYAIGYSGLSDHISYHFPAHVKGRTIYREAFNGKMGVGIFVVDIDQ